MVRANSMADARMNDALATVAAAGFDLATDFDTRATAGESARCQRPRDPDR